MDNLFKGLAAAKTSERGSFFNPGVYTVRVKNVLMKRTRKNFDAFILECTVEKSNYVSSKADAIKSFGDKPYDLAELEKTLPNKEGTTASWFQSLQDADIGFGAIKGFAAAITASDPNDAEFVNGVEALMTSAVEEGSLDGMLLPLEVVAILTKKGTQFSLHRFGAALSEGP
jgi:hypothetical protein